MNRYFLVIFLIILPINNVYGQLDSHQIFPDFVVSELHNKTPSYTLIPIPREITTNRNETVKINIYISGLGNIKNNKILLFIPQDLLNPENPGLVGATIDCVTECLFSWDGIPGIDNVRLIEYLTQKIGTDWVKTAKIEKIDSGRTIRVSTERNSLSLRLNDEKTKVNLEIDDSRTDELITKTENGKLYICRKNITIPELLDKNVTLSDKVIRLSLCNFMHQNLIIEENVAPPILSERTNDGKPPLYIIMNIANKAIPGDYDIHLVFTYTDGLKWYQDKEKITIHVNNPVEEYRQLLFIVSTMLVLILTCISIEDKFKKILSSFYGIVIVFVTIILALIILCLFYFSL